VCCERNRLRFGSPYQRIAFPSQGLADERIMNEQIEIGYQTFINDGGEEFGAVRKVSPGGQPELVIYVENAGEFVVPLDAVKAVHSGKVILDYSRLDSRLQKAIDHAHDAEKPGA
jgi:hypothetical protein